MKLEKLIKAAHRLADPYRISNGGKFRLKDVDPGDTGDLTSEDKPAAKEGLAMGVTALTEMQEMLYAQDKWSVLLIFQAMDAAGKDGAIRHVMSGVNPQGCQVYSFKAPSAEELDHDFMWRSMKSLSWSCRATTPLRSRRWNSRWRRRKRSRTSFTLPIKGSSCSNSSARCRV